MTTRTTAALTEFSWLQHPEAAGLVNELLATLREFEPISQFANKLRQQTGTRLLDWVDHIALPATDELIARVQSSGFKAETDDIATTYGIPGTTFRHPGAILPPLRLNTSGNQQRLAIRADSVIDFLAANGATHTESLHGLPFSIMRRATIASDATRAFVVVERHGDRRDRDESASPEHILNWLAHLERFRLRARHLDDDDKAFELTDWLIDSAIADLGVDQTCELFFLAEREYWQRRNKAARVQKALNDSLGLGWANHDHHTYRCSRLNFHRIIPLLEKLGLQCRERFYAGKDAGWGAQVLEQPRTGIIVFADVDLSPEEIHGDIGHEPLPPRSTFGTVGLWVELHGEAFLQAGMHHLECQFEFDASRDLLAAHGIKTMKPFTDFPFLRQAFTEGEVWPVCPQRLERLLHAQAITATQADQFRERGAVGSHLEVLERNDGYKGFNQTGINEIIRDTDPRKLTAAL